MNVMGLFSTGLVLFMNFLATELEIQDFLHQNFCTVHCFFLLSTFWNPPPPPKKKGGGKEHFKILIIND
jgi:hypothetical protein